MLSRLSTSAALIRVQSWSAGASPPEALGRLLALDWPAQVGDVAHGDLDVICIGPKDWLLVSDSDGDAGQVFQELEEALVGSTFRATDFSSALVRFRIDGVTGLKLLSKACALDVYSQSLAPGRAPRTLIAGLPVVIRCLEPTVFEYIAPLSYADYLLSWLTDASAEFASND